MIACSMPKFSSPSEDNRLSPYLKSITKPISKSLLTPCRRIGLSRKKNSPSTPLNTASPPVIIDNGTPTSSSRPMKCENKVTEVNDIGPVKKSTLKISTKSKANDANLINTEHIKRSNKGQLLEDQSSFKQKVPESESINIEPPKKKLAKLEMITTETKVDEVAVNPVETEKAIKEKVETNSARVQFKRKSTDKSSKKKPIKLKMNSTRSIVDEVAVNSVEAKKSNKEQAETKIAGVQPESGSMDKKKPKKLAELEKDSLPELSIDEVIVNPLEAEKPVQVEIQVVQNPEESFEPERDPTRSIDSVDKRSENSSDDEFIVKANRKPGFAKVLFKSTSDEEMSSSLESISVTQNNCKSDQRLDKSHEKKATQWRRTLSLKKVPDKEQAATKRIREIVPDKEQVASRLMREIVPDKEQAASKLIIDEESMLKEFKIKPCSVTLQMLPSSELSESTEELQKIVIEKRKILQNLKQAEVYRKLHNLESLEQLTMAWKRGCISGLEDLLVQLRTHAEIDMDTLLTNLRIPREYISLSADGNLE